MTRFILFAAISIAFANEPTTPGALWKAFNADPSAFKEQNNGKKITILATIADTYMSIYMTPVVSLVDKAGEESKVICVLPRSDSGKLSTYKNGEKVKMTGSFYSAHDEKIVIKQCQGEGK
ncbi:MAG: hypothetical protein FWC26_07460 [Fibromonadales bacterium]|nr:hypothetical protein [Fibromonadales bacterium]